tara:strand:+ start:16282 stop:17199 length:918 start_codon:yes stop_codon:yes gene_type:complete
MYFTILLYHGVTDQKSKGIENFSGKHLNYRDFSTQMKWLQKNANVISMEEVSHLIKNKIKFTKKTVAVTFDDGFKNNATVAAPILDKFNIPATFYISAGQIGKNNPFWVDIIENCINKTSLQEISLNLNVQKKFNIRSYHEKINAVSKIKKYCKKISNDERKKVILNLEKVTSVKTSSKTCKNYNIMSWKDIKNLSAKSNFIIGGHSMNHEILSSLSIKEMKINIAQSIRLIENKIGSPVRHYSYPEGQRNHYNLNVINALKKNNIICCPSAINGMASSRGNLFNLKRIMVGLGGIEFPYKRILR